MAIPPTTRTPAVGPVRAPHNDLFGPDDNRPDAVATRAERDARERITRAEKSVDSARVDANNHIDQIRDENQAYLSDIAATNETNLEKERMKGYEQIRELKRSMQAEMGRVRRDGERQLSDLKNYYRDSEYGLEKNGNEKAREIDMRQSRELEFKNKNTESLLESARIGHQQKVEDLHRNQQDQFQRQYDEYQKTVEDSRLATQNAREQALSKYEQSYQATLQGQQESIARLNANAVEKIRDIKQNSASKLAAYASRQSDPFYKMVDIAASISDEGDSYILRATVPDHEREHLTINVRGNRELVISGSRRNEEKLQLEEGGSKATSSFQSYSESFPLAQPVEPKLLTREFDGDQLIVRLPKSGSQAQYEAYQAKHKGSALAASKAQAERPKFPSNLPAQADASAPTRGGKPLT